jgi:magnesium chelatase subunit D
MNPEEGDLRPQLLDRFGLSVSIESIRSVGERVEIVKRRLAFEQDPEGFAREWAESDFELTRRMQQASRSLSQVVFPENLLETAAQLSLAMETDGHRADIVMMKTARANAALEERSKVTQEDLQLAAKLVLSHRIKKTPLQKAELNQEKLQEILDQSASVDAAGQEWTPVHQNQKPETRIKTHRSPVDCVTHLCSGSKVFQPHIPWNRLTLGTHPGRRFVLPNPDRGGSVHGSRFLNPGDAPEDISVMGTIRAAAPYQRSRGANGSLKINWGDLRLRKRSRKTGLALMMIVDSSASMRNNDRMSVTKGVIESLLRDLYLRRDKMGIITFRHKDAEVVLPMTQNIRNAAEEVETLPVGGRTPLAAGLELGIRLLSQEKRKNPETLPVILLFSDGNPNVSCFGRDPLEETLSYAREVQRQDIQAILVDTETSTMAMGCGYEIARHMNAVYLPLHRLEDNGF